MRTSFAFLFYIFAIVLLHAITNEESNSVIERDIDLEINEKSSSTIKLDVLMMESVNSIKNMSPDNRRTVIEQYVINTKDNANSYSKNDNKQIGAHVVALRERINRLNSLLASVRNNGGDSIFEKHIENRISRLDNVLSLIRENPEDRRNAIFELSKSKIISLSIPQKTISYNSQNEIEPLYKTISDSVDFIEANINNSSYKLIDSLGRKNADERRDTIYNYLNKQSRESEDSNNIHYKTAKTSNIPEE